MRADPKTPIYDIKRPDGMSLDQQRRLLDTVQALNRDQKTAYPLDQELESRIANYELAARMQVEALKVADLDEEGEIRDRRITRRLLWVVEALAARSGGADPPLSAVRHT